MSILTVIICTYNRAKFLGTCLQSIIDQSTSTNDFNVLIVNNNSDDNTLEVANSFHGKIHNLEVVTENKQGLSYARNTGAHKAQTEWIAYLDDDAKARTNWVETILATIDKGDFDIFGGVFTAWHCLQERPRWFSPDWESNDGLQEEYGLLSTGYIGGGNCVYRRNLIFQFNGFHTSLGMNGKTISYAEESLLIEDMLAAGIRVGFVPYLLIDHCVLPYKYSIIWRMKSVFSRNRDSIIIKKRPLRIRTLLYYLSCAIYSVVIRLPIKLIKLLLWKNYYIQNAILDGLSPAFMHIGRCVGLLRKL